MLLNTLKLVLGLIMVRRTCLMSPDMLNLVATFGTSVKLKIDQRVGASLLESKFD